MLRLNFFLVILIMVAGCDGGIQVFDWDEPDPTTVLIVNEPDGAFKTITVVVYKKVDRDFVSFTRFALDAFDKKELILPLDTTYRIEASFKQEYGAGNYLFSDIVEGYVDNSMDNYNNSQYGEVIIFYPNPRYWHYQAIASPPPKAFGGGTIKKECIFYANSHRSFMAIFY